MHQIVTPFPRHALPRIWTWSQAFRHQVMDDYGPASLDEFISDWDSKGDLRLSWGVEQGGELGGVIVVDRVSPVLGCSHCIFKRAFWGHEVTREAMREVYAAAFASGLTKLYSVIFSDNSAVIHLAHQLGAKREGKLRQHTLRGGKPADMLVLGLTREDFAKCLPT